MESRPPPWRCWWSRGCRPSWRRGRAPGWRLTRGRSSSSPVSPREDVHMLSSSGEMLRDRGCSATCRSTSPGSATGWRLTRGRSSSSPASPREDVHSEAFTKVASSRPLTVQLRRKVEEEEVKLREGGSVRLQLPENKGPYKWLLNDREVPGETGNFLDI